MPNKVNGFLTKSQLKNIFVQKSTLLVFLLINIEQKYFQRLEIHPLFLSLLFSSSEMCI